MMILPAIIISLFCAGIGYDIARDMSSSQNLRPSCSEYSSSEECLALVKVISKEQENEDIRLMSEIKGVK